SPGDHVDAPLGIVTLDPARAANSKVARGVVDDGQAGVGHEPKLHSLPGMAELELPDRYNVAADLLGRNLRDRAEKIAIHHAGGEVRYRELSALACGAATSLLEHGVRREERVLLVAYDSPGWVASFLGAGLIGA